MKFNPLDLSQPQILLDTGLLQVKKQHRLFLFYVFFQNTLPDTFYTPGHSIVYSIVYLSSPASQTSCRESKVLLMMQQTGWISVRNQQFCCFVSLFPFSLQGNFKFSRSFYLPLLELLQERVTGPQSQQKKKNFSL